MLVAANLVPVLGVLFWHWDLFAVLALFWMENVVIGLYSILKVAYSGAHRRYRDGFVVPWFFVAHYGGFMFGHAFLIAALFHGPPEGSGPPYQMHDYFLPFLRADLGIAAIALLLSHGWSFVTNFVGGNEVRNLTVGQAMALPYRRMIITHVSLLVGGYWLQELGQPLAGLILLMAMKTGLDVIMHRSEHRRLAK